MSLSKIEVRITGDTRLLRRALTAAEFHLALLAGSPWRQVKLWFALWRIDRDLRKRPPQ